MLLFEVVWYSQPTDATEDHKYPPLNFILLLIKAYLPKFIYACAFVRLFISSWNEEKIGRVIKCYTGRRKVKIPWEKTKGTNGKITQGHVDPVEWMKNQKKADWNVRIAWSLLATRVRGAKKITGIRLVKLRPQRAEHTHSLFLVGWHWDLMFLGRNYHTHTRKEGRERLEEKPVMAWPGVRYFREVWAIAKSWNHEGKESDMCVRCYFEREHFGVSSSPSPFLSSVTRTQSMQGMQHIAAVQKLKQPLGLGFLVTSPCCTIDS